MSIRRVVLLYLTFLTVTGFQPARPAGQADPAARVEMAPPLFQNLKWRCIGPANMVGRITDVEGVPGDPNIIYVGSASGGIWKTVNGGVTWAPIFDRQPVASIGDLALEPGNPDVIYAGTGESNVRNSVSFGNGVYKSTDGGKTWVHLGLEKTERVSRIVINPRNPRIVYVGALGGAFGPNPERGVFMSTDGGQSWSRQLYIDERHGVADLDIHPQNPNIVYASMWRFERKPWTFTSGDTLGGLFRSIDGGIKWTKLQSGLPELVGRIGVKVAPDNPDTVYVMTESPQGTLYKSVNGGESFERISQNAQIVSRGFYYTDLRIDPTDENRVYAVSSSLFVSIDGGNRFERISSSTHSDYHSLWIDPLNPHRLMQGTDGGVYVSSDRGRNWGYLNNFPVSQFYQIFADNREPFYFVGGGLQDNGTWYAPNRTREPFGILNSDWKMISFGDGFHIVSHPDNPDLFISEYQGGGISRTDMRTREQQDVSPQARRADGAPVSSLEYRFNWNTPIVLSPHDRNTVYVGGNVVFRSSDFGTSWEKISPDLTTNDADKQKTAGGPAWPENTTAEYHCTIISLAESPVQPDVIWAGTDDGKLHVTMDGGVNWRSVENGIPDLPDEASVSHVEPSRTSAGMAYCAFDRHMLNDFRPYIFRTTDFGRTWIDVTGNLPERAHVWVVREDPRNPQVIYAGTELGLYVSFSRGREWVRLHMGNLPTVAVHDLLVQPRDNDLILGTHGRGMWILDRISFLQEMQPELLEEMAYVFTVGPAMRFAVKPNRYGIGDGLFKGENPPYGALITYYLREEPGEGTSVSLEILDESRQEVRRLPNVPAKAGLNRAVWDLRYPESRPRREEAPDIDPFWGSPGGPQVLPGLYTVRLTIGENSFEKPLRVRMDPSIEFSLEEMQTQLRLSFQLRDMKSLVNDALRALDSVRSQLLERKKITAGRETDFPEEVPSTLDTGLRRIQEIQDLLSKPEGRPFWSEGPRLIDRLGSLFSSIDGVNAPPTPAQHKYFDELTAEFESAVTDVNAFLGAAVEEINRIFASSQIPALLAPPLIRRELSP